MTRWREVLTALTDDTLDAVERQAVLARAAVRLAADRGTPERQPTVEEVVTLAHEEFGVPLDAGQVRSALDTREPTDG
ncbi:hypothetical protein AB0A76_18295 [Streptomyces exfoliatus]|uniref:Uncharacterized protein n=1 Tax=Streptomyces exfoliatus TaxID=1905 RepID=A0ABV3CY63_STREX